MQHTNECKVAHHAGLSAVLARLLFPKLRKRTGRLGGRGAPGSARAAILNFLAAAPPAELRPLLELFLDPLAGAFRRPAGTELGVSTEAAAVEDIRYSATRLTEFAATHVSAVAVSRSWLCCWSAWTSTTQMM